MNIKALQEFEWHDLPLLELRLGENAVELLVTPWSEETNAYRQVRLVLRSSTSIHLKMEGDLTAEDFQNMEVASFKLEEGPFSLLSGEIGILPGTAGYWTITFRDAQWELQ